MSQAVVPAPVAIPFREIVPWAVFGGVLALFVLFFVGVEDSVVTLLFSDGRLHEFLHDGRHLLAMPCH